MAITFSEGVTVGKSSLTSVMLSTVKGDCLCDFESGTSDVARAQVSACFVCFAAGSRDAHACKVVWQRLQKRCVAGCLKAHSDSDIASAAMPFVRCYAKVAARTLHTVFLCVLMRFCSARM